jgi:hypothetical protein
MDKKKFISGLMSLARRYEYNIDDFELELFWERLSVFEEKKVLEAIKYFFIYFSGGKNRFPSIKDIEEKIVGKQPDAKESANDIVTRMYQAISRFGYMSPVPAKEYVGDIGWYAFGGDRGYIDTCKTLDEDQIGTWKAQARGAVEAGIAKLKAGYNLDDLVQIKFDNERIGSKMNVLQLASSLCPPK